MMNDFFSFNIGNVITWLSVFVTTGGLCFVLTRMVSAVDEKSDKRFQENTRRLNDLSEANRKLDYIIKKLDHPKP